MFFRHFISITLCLVVSTAAADDAGVWQLAGTASVKETPADATQRAEIRLMSARGPFTKIRLQVADGPVTLDHVVVTFAHGSTQSADLKKKFDPGAITREIDLTGNDHVIRKVVVWYTAPKFANLRLYAH